jgi:hypothetical protein
MLKTAGSLSRVSWSDVTRRIFQEVDHFNFLKTVLGTQGYNGLFFPKPDSPCLYIKGNNGPDGCAIFFREDKFELLKTVTRVLEVWRVQSNQVSPLFEAAHSHEMCFTAPPGQTHRHASMRQDPLGSHSIDSC